MNVFIVRYTNSAHEIGDISAVYDNLDDAKEEGAYRISNRGISCDIEEWPVGARECINLWSASSWDQEWKKAELT